MPEKVKDHTHHTPRVYLRRFADLDGVLVAERPGKQAAKPIPVPEVGVRRRFYTVELSDGTHSNEVEDKLALLEGKVKNAFREIDNEALPLDFPTKVIVAQFLGQQMARGITYREMRSAHIADHERLATRPCSRPVPQALRQAGRPASRSQRGRRRICACL